MNNKLTIFGNDKLFKPVQAAIENLISGKTPITEIRKKTGRGGYEQNYVNGYYMFLQASLITGFRWQSECLQEKYIPDEINPVEIGALMKVTLYDQQGNAYSHTTWGSNGVARWKYDGKSENGTLHKSGDIISIFESLKAAYTDGIKKALSYFGIANDVYGGRELDYFSEFEENQNEIITDNYPIDQRTYFDKYVVKNNVRYDIVIKLLGKPLNEITDWYAAYKVIKDYVENKK